VTHVAIVVALTRQFVYVLTLYIHVLCFCLMPCDHINVHCSDHINVECTLQNRRPVLCSECSVAAAISTALSCIMYGMLQKSKFSQREVYT